MGCGRVGAMLADELDAQGHSVAIIDRRSDAFQRLGPDFSGQRIHGSGFDRVILKKAHIDEACAFAAVSNGDNANIIAARTARDLFDVPRVVARIADPERAELYERLGVPTIASARRTAAAILKRVVPPNAEVVWTGPLGSVALVAVRPSQHWYGVSIHEVERATSARVAFISRLTEVLVARNDMVVQEEDELYVGADRARVVEVRDVLTHPLRSEAHPPEGTIR